MAEQGVIGGSRFAIPRSAIPFFVAAAVYVLLILLGERLLNDPDTYVHLAVGRWIVEHRAFLTGDHFTHTMPGAHWVAFEWLSEILYTGAYYVGGWPAVVALTAIAAATALGLLTRFLLDEIPPLPALALATTALGLLAPHLLARPHVLALPVMVGWIGVLVRSLDHGRKPPFLLLPLMVLWANLHGSFTLGVAFVLPIALESVYQAERPARRSVALQWLLFGILTVIAASLTPYGAELFLVTYRALSLGDALSIIVEWQPQDFGRFGAFEMCLLLAIGFALYRGLTLPPMRILVLLGLLHLALWQGRHADVLGLLGPLFIARPLAQHFHWRRWHPAVRLPSLAAASLLAVLAVMTGFFFTRDIAPDPRITPATAIAAADLAKVGPILNDHAFGGYLAYVGVPSFIDGRGEMFGAFTLRHHRAVTLQNLGDFLRLLDEYRIAATLLTPTTPAVALLDRLPGWQRIYADGVAVVHIRRKNTASNGLPVDAPSGPLRSTVSP
jgi:hypothetical protein